MRTVKIDLFEFDELTEEAQQWAKDNTEYPGYYDQDISDSLRKAREIYSLFGYIERPIEGIRLFKWVVNNIIPEWTSRKYYSMAGRMRLSKLFMDIDPIHMTGVSYDYDFMAPILDFLKDPSGPQSSEYFARYDLGKIAEKIQEAEIEGFYEDFGEYCTENEKWFFKDGTPFEEVFNDIIVSNL